MSRSETPAVGDANGSVTGFLKPFTTIAIKDPIRRAHRTAVTYVITVRKEF
jgi:hypothetical protein